MSLQQAQQTVGKIKCQAVSGDFVINSCQLFEQRSFFHQSLARPLGRALLLGSEFTSQPNFCTNQSGELNLDAKD